MTDLTFRKETINGMSVSVLKSALQKYARRGEVEKGLNVLAHIDSVRTYEIDSEHIWASNAKKIRTNMINRLVVMMSEEISIHYDSHNMGYISLLYSLYLKWCQNRKNKNSAIYLIEFYKTLCHSKKYRLISDLKTVYNLPPYYLNNTELLENLHRELLLKNKLKDTFEIIYNSISSLDELKGDILRKRYSCFAHLSNMISNGQKIKDIFLALLNMNAFENFHNVIDILKYFYQKMTHKEKYIYLYHAILICLEKENLINDFNSIIRLKASTDECKDHFNCKNIKLDSYVYDVHTGDKSKTIVDFAQNGAKIKTEDEDLTFANSLYRNMYNEFKEILMGNPDIKTPTNKKKNNVKKDSVKKDSVKKDSVKKDSVKSDTFQKIIEQLSAVFKIGVDYIDKDQINFITNLPHAQKITGLYKKVLYVDDNYVYKGCYQISENTFKNMFINSYLINKINDFLNLKERHLEPETLLITPNNTIFLKYKNIGTPVKSENIDIVSSKLETNVKVIKRETFVKRVTEEEKGKNYIKKYKNEIFGILVYLYTLLIANVGDYGTHNMLIGKNGSLYGIDIEEKRRVTDVSVKKDILLDDLMKKPSKLKYSIYESYMGKLNELHKDALSKKLFTNLVEWQIFAESIFK